MGNKKYYITYELIHHHKGTEMDVKWVSDESHVGVAGRKLDALVVVLERVENVAEELLGNATDVVQVDLLQLTVILLQFFQHLDVPCYSSW